MTERDKHPAARNWRGPGLTRAEMLRRSLGVGVGLSVGGGLLAACSDDASSGGGRLPSDGSAITMDELVASAKDEGRLNLIALPPDWVNYGEVIETFKDKYGLRTTVASPNATGAQENQAVETLKDSPRAPDNLDLGLPLAIDGVRRKLYAPYRNSQWETIPDRLKEPSGLWTGDYWGVLAIGVNREVVPNPPTSMRELLEPAYKGQVALYGDPQSTGSAFAAVWAASLANGGSLDDIAPGIDFFAELKEKGNYIPVQASPGTIASGQTPITLDFDYLQLAYRDEVQDQVDWQVNIPRDAVYGNHACQAISKWAPHPWAARLWQEFLYSDEGQLLWLKGYAHPARFDDLLKRKAIPQQLLDRLPPASAYGEVQFPTAAQTAKATKAIAAEWSKKVG
jgi:putative spermidine/putrescine transport system substrate-binding protein